MRKIVLLLLLFSCSDAGAQSGPWMLWGKIRAAAFGTWTLQSLTAAPAPGRYTLRVDTASPPVVAGGPQIQPLAANAALLVGSGPDQEVATPSAVSCSWISGHCTITIALAKAHLAPFSLRSATDGLQEAINYARGTGGGTVVLDPGWTGTLDEITAAVGVADVLISDERPLSRGWYAWAGDGYLEQLRVMPQVAAPWALADRFAGGSPAAQLRSSLASAPGALAAPPSFGAGLPTQPWQPDTAFSIGAFVADGNGGIEECTGAGTSGAAAPDWATEEGGITTDGSVVWTLRPGNVLSTAFFDFRNGTAASPTTGRGVYPYGSIFIPVWDQSNAGASNSVPFEPLNNSSPNTFGTIIHESGGASPAGLLVDDEFQWPGGDYTTGLAPAAAVECTLNPGDTHRGCWGINEGVSSWDKLQELFGNEVNLFNDSGDASRIVGGHVTSGPYWGFAATDSSDGGGGTAGFVAENGTGGHGHFSDGWAYDFLGVGARVNDFMCGVPGGGVNPEPGCLFSNSRGLAQTVSTRWSAGHYYERGLLVLDGNHNVEMVTTAGLSGAAPPVWVSRVDGTTHDGSAVWTLEAFGDAVNWPSLPLQLEATVRHQDASTPVDALISYAPSSNNTDSEVGLKTVESDASGGAGREVGFLTSAGWYELYAGVSALPASGTDAPGSAFGVAGGASTGSAAGGPIDFLLSPSASSGAAVNPANVVGDIALLASPPSEPASVGARLDFGALHFEGGAPAITLGCYMQSSSLVYDGAGAPCLREAEDGANLYLQIAPAGGAGGPAAPVTAMAVAAGTGNVAFPKSVSVARSLTIGADAPMSAAPRLVYSAFVPKLADPIVAATWIPDQPVVVTRIEAQAQSAPAGCSIDADIEVTDGVTSQAVVLAGAANDSGPIARSFPAGAAVTIRVATGAIGCASPPANVNVTIQYRMQ